MAEEAILPRDPTQPAHLSSAVVRTSTTADAARSAPAKKRKHEPPCEDDALLLTPRPLLLGGPLYPDLYHQVFQFVAKCVLQSPFFSLDTATTHLEIEAKLGRIVEKHSGDRVCFPITCESIVQSNQYRFESDMSLHQHAHFNQLLNSLVGPSKEIRYTHLHETDRFFPRSYHEKVRVTFDTQTNKIVPNGILCKSKLGSLDIHLPTTPLDLRFSVNLETHVPFPKGVQVDPQERRKDRLSYTHDWLQVDLTQVKTFDRNSQRTTTITHELEFELSHVHTLLDLPHRSTDTPQMRQRLVYLLQNARRFADHALLMPKERLGR